MINLLQYLSRTGVILFCMLCFGSGLRAETATNLVYTPAGWPAELQGDLHRPATPGPHPVVLVVHGGGWSAGSRHESYVTDICKRLTARGYAAFNVSYRLAPQHLYPAPEDDLRQALQWLRSHAGEYDLDAGRIGAWGYSAGAHLVSLLGNRQPLPDSGGVRLGAVIAGGTPADLRKWPNSPLVRAFIGQSRDAAPELWADASPVLQVSADSAPHFLYHGRLDTLVQFDQAVDLEAALRKAGVPVQLHVLPLYGHILAALLAGEASERAIDFLDQHLGRRP